MLKAILSGATGTMGKVILTTAKENGIDIIAGIGNHANDAIPCPIYSSFNDLGDIEADILIDFSHASVIPSLSNYLEQKKIPAVIATTGMNDYQMSCIHEASLKTAIFLSFNMSIGINLLTELTKKAASCLSPLFDIEIIEKHHNRKVDSPSGTAIMLANSISQVSDYKSNFYNTSSNRTKRTIDEIGIHSLRGGNIVGDHEVMFLGTDEVITISHSARSREVFATGVYKASNFIYNKPPGLYNMKDLI